MESREEVVKEIFTQIIETSDRIKSVQLSDDTDAKLLENRVKDNILSLTQKYEENKPKTEYNAESILFTDEEKDFMFDSAVDITRNFDFDGVAKLAKLYKEEGKSDEEFMKFIFSCSFGHVFDKMKADLNLS